MRSATTFVLALLASQPAIASGGLHCVTEAADAAFEVSGGVTRGMGSPLFSFDGTWEIGDAAIADDLAKGAFSREHVAQYWLDGKELRLVVYREREGDEAHGYVELTILTKALGEDDEGIYGGRYVLTVFDAAKDNGGEGVTVEREGEVTCSAE